MKPISALCLAALRYRKGQSAPATAYPAGAAVPASVTAIQAEAEAAITGIRIRMAKTRDMTVPRLLYKKGTAENPPASADGSAPPDRSRPNLSGSFNGSQKKTKDQDDSESKKYENRIESIRFTEFIYFTFLYGISDIPIFKRSGKLFRFQDLSGSGKQFSS